MVISKSYLCTVRYADEVTVLKRSCLDFSVTLQRLTRDLLCDSTNFCDSTASETLCLLASINNACERHLVIFFWLYGVKLGALKWYKPAGKNRDISIFYRGTTKQDSDLDQNMT